jgi:hypothetical protein
MNQRQSRYRNQSIATHSGSLCDLDPGRLGQMTFALLAKLPIPARSYGQRFVHFTNTILQRMNELTDQLIRGFLQELDYSPENADQVSVYYAQLLVQRINKEVDALYRCLAVDTIDIIHNAYERWIMENTPEKQS